MALVKGPDTEPIPGYRLIAPLGSGGFGEVWKCEAPGGLFKAIKFVGGADMLDVDPLQAQQEWKALQRIKGIRHPFLLGMDRVEVVDGELIIVMELADRSLADVLAAHQEAGRPGIPREELLGYLREAAEVLDLINQEHNLQHLDIKPANLFVVNNHVKVGDFGLVKGLAEGATDSGSAPGGLTPLYCAPEALEGRVGHRSDQYSLAVVYQELLTGRLPFQGRSFNEVLLRRMMNPPDLSPLPEDDRPIVRRALDNNPLERFNSCTEFLQALASRSEPVPSRSRSERETTEVRDELRRTKPSPSPTTTQSTIALRRDTKPRPPTKGETNPPSSPGNPALFAGYRLLKNLSPGPLCEAWKVEGPDRNPYLLKFPCAHGDGRDVTRRLAIDLLSALDHPGLLAVTVIEEGSRLALVSQLVVTSLADRFRHYRGLGQTGVPRRELLDLMLAAADTLDSVYVSHGLHHLCLNPRALLLKDEALPLVTDLGVAQLFWLPSGQLVGPLNGRYAAPELFDGEVTPTTDQYSLAVIFQEMLIGTFPFRGIPGRGRSTRPDLDLLPASDRAPILKALDPDPGRRFTCCRELIDALDSAVHVPTGGAVTNAPEVLLPPIIPAPTAAPPVSLPELPPAAVALDTLFSVAAGSLRLHQSGALQYLLDPGRSLRHTWGGRLTRQLVRLKLDGYCQQWRAEFVGGQDGTFLIRVPVSASFWQRCLGRQPSLQMSVSLTAPDLREGGVTEVDVEIQPIDCPEAQAAALLEEQGPALLESLRIYLQVEGEQRRLTRVPFAYPLNVFPVLDGPVIGEPAACQGKDISLEGVGLYAPAAPPSPLLYVQPLLTPELSQVALLGRVKRVHPVAGDQYEIGLVFVEEPEPWPPPE